MSEIVLHDADLADTAPGDEKLDGSGVAHGVQGYLLGLALACGLTIASFAAARSGVIWAPSVPAALVALAVAQMAIHIVFFLHITTGPDSANNVIALVFGTTIVLLVIAGSLFIMSNLNEHMMPMDKIMEMQR
jgi:cytochrome o ubiquinol oxidase operon protein cyoD